MILQQRFRERLQQALDLSGVSQSELARKMGVKPQYVHDYLKGHRPEPGLAVVEKFALAFDLPVHSLIDDSDLAELFTVKT